MIIRMFIVSKFRKQLPKLQVILLYFGKNYNIIKLEYAYKVALKYGVNNKEETKQKVLLMRKGKLEQSRRRRSEASHPILKITEVETSVTNNRLFESSPHQNDHNLSNFPNCPLNSKKLYDTYKCTGWARRSYGKVCKNISVKFGYQAGK